MVRLLSLETFCQIQIRLTFSQGPLDNAWPTGRLFFKRCTPCVPSSWSGASLVWCNSNGRHLSSWPHIRSGQSNLSRWASLRSGVLLDVSTTLEVLPVLNEVQRRNSTPNPPPKRTTKYSLICPGVWLQLHDFYSAEEWMSRGKNGISSQWTSFCSLYLQAYKQYMKGHLGSIQNSVNEKGQL